MKFSKNENIDFKLFFDLRKKKEYKEAIAILRRLSKKNKGNRVINGLFAIIFYEIEDYSKSRYYFKRATILNERSEIASLGLFHSLCELGKEILALKELDRFITDNKPQHYKITISELNKSIKNSSDQKRNKMIAKILLKASKWL